MDRRAAGGRHQRQQLALVSAAARPAWQDSVSPGGGGRCPGERLSFPFLPPLLGVSAKVRLSGPMSRESRRFRVCGVPISAKSSVCVRAG